MPVDLATGEEVTAIDVLRAAAKLGIASFCAQGQLSVPDARQLFEVIPALVLATTPTQL